MRLSGNMRPNRAQPFLLLPFLQSTKLNLFTPLFKTFIINHHKKTTLCLVLILFLLTAIALPIILSVTVIQKPNIVNIAGSNLLLAQSLVIRS